MPRKEPGMGTPLLVEADMAWEDRLNTLDFALERMKCNATVAAIAHLIFRRSAGGKKLVEMPYELLCGRPNGGCCSEDTAIRSVRALEENGLITVKRSDWGPDRANQYAFDIEGTREFLRRERDGSAPRREAEPQIAGAEPQIAGAEPQIAGAYTAHTCAPRARVPGPRVLQEELKPGARDSGPGWNSDRGALARRLPRDAKGVAVLRSTAELLDLLRDVCEKDPLPDVDHECEQDRQRWIAAAEHALRVANRSPVGMFTKIVSKGLWANISNEADEAARRRLVAFDRELRRAECEAYA